MNTSKLTSLSILLGMLILMGIFSFPAQAQTAHPENKQLNSASGKPPTNTKKAKSTPRKTTTPKPANTATKAATKQNTSVPASLTSIPQSTQIGTMGTAVSTGNVPSTLSNSASATLASLSATPTAVGINTLAVQQTKTAGASFLTSTSLALTFSPTPTNFGAPTGTTTSTPNAADLTASSLPLTATPALQASQTALASSPTPFRVPAQVSVSHPDIPVTARGSKWYWIAAASICIAILLGLFYLLYQEWKRSSVRGWKISTK